MTPTADARPVLIVVAGANGAGKTTLTREMLNHEWIEGCVYSTDHRWAEAMRALVPPEVSAETS